MKEIKDYFTCDYCQRVGTGITIVNGFKMCPMCLAEYQHKSGENNELREELGRKIKEVEQLKKNEDLKSAQNKVSVEKLEELKIKLLNKYNCTNYETNACELAFEVIDDMIAELKGEKDE